MRRDEKNTRYAIRETVNATRRTAPFAVAFVRLLQYLFVACRVLKEAAEATIVRSAANSDLIKSL